MLIRHRLAAFANRVYRSASAIFVPEFDVIVPRHRNVLAVLGTPVGRFLIPASNIVTNAGDIYYAQAAVGEATTNAFNRLVLASAGTPAKDADYADFTPIGSTAKAHTATYPKTADADADNTGGGADIITHLFSYTKSDFNHAAISRGLITNTGPVASPPTPILTGFAFASTFEKTANDTLKVFVNHEFLGV
jgi:hypothetical protein